MTSAGLPENMVNDILDSLDDIGHNSESFSEETICKVCEKGPRSLTYTKLVSTISSELRQFYNITENVNAIKDDNDSESFLFEISGFLNEYGCPYSSLTTKDLTQRLSTSFDCGTLLLFLSSELQAAKMYFRANPKAVSNAQQSGSEEGNALFDNAKAICLTLKMTKPPDDIEVSRFFEGISKKLSEATKANGKNLSSPIIKQQLGPTHFEKLNAINQALCMEYGTRRSMLLKRLDVTIASFNWSEKAKKNLNDIAAAYQKKRHALTSKSSVSIASLLAARDDLSQIYKTSSGSTRHQCAINKVLIGKVPDRGGRPNEAEPPPPEMPSWQKRQDDGGSRRGGRGGYRGGRGDHHQHQNSYNHPGGRGNQRPSSGRGSSQQGRGQSRWGRGRGGYNASVGPGDGGGSFNQVFGHGGQSYGRDGFRGSQTYTS